MWIIGHSCDIGAQGWRVQEVSERVPEARFLGHLDVSGME